MTRFAIPLLALCLAGCGGAKTDERDTAAGKILPGSISDSMLQTDGLQSEAPLAAPKIEGGDEEADAKAAKKGGKDDKAEDAKAPEVEATSPAATPAPASSPTPPPSQ